MKEVLDSVRSGLVELQQTWESVFKHTFSARKGSRDQVNRIE